MKECESCRIEPVVHDGSNTYVYCPNCKRTTMFHDNVKDSIKDWENGIIKTEDELKLIWREIKKRERIETPYYVPSNALINFKNSNLPPPVTEY